MSTVAKRRAQARAIARNRASRQTIYRAPYVTGRGTYRRVRPAAQKRSGISLPSNLGSMVGGAAGTFLGGPLGGVIGSGLGHLAQGLVKHITGFGDYNVEVNTLMGAGFSPPELINLSKHAVCLRHREYIGDITASSAFTIQSYPINPGQSDTFPWLSGVANNFEEYMVTGMIFEYKTLSADYTTASSAALGYVAMATQYNSLQPDFVDKIHLENYEFSNSAKPSETFIHPVECKRSLNPVSQLYVRTGPVEANADQRLYDLGKFQIATGGNSGSGILGELWCTYEVCLFKPKLVEVDDAALTAHYRLTDINNNAPLGASPAVQAAGSTLELTIDGTSITFPDTLTEGKFMCNFTVWGSAATINDPTLTALSGCSLKQYLKTDTVTQASCPANGVSATIYNLLFILEITAGGAVVVISDDGVLPASATDGDLWVAQINDDIAS